jgi:hypothetical protein
MSNDVEKAQAIVADLEAKRHALIRNGTDLSDEHAHVALAAYYSGDAKARKRLDEIEAALSKHTVDLASIDAALKAAAANVTAARAAADRSTNAEHIAKVHALLTDLLAVAPQLDLMTADARNPDSGKVVPVSEPPRHLKNPPLQVRIADLVGALLAELRALGLARYQLVQFDIGMGGKKTLTVDVTFPPWNWSAASPSDLKKELTATIGKYQRDYFSAGQRDTFKALIGGWAARIKADTNTEVAA